MLPPVVAPTNQGGFAKDRRHRIRPGRPLCILSGLSEAISPRYLRKNERPGGMLVYGILLKLEKDVVDAREIEVLRQLGVDIRLQVEVGRDIALDTRCAGRAIEDFYVAISCQDGRSAVPARNTTNHVMTAVDFLHAVNPENETCNPWRAKALSSAAGTAIDVARTSVQATDAAEVLHVPCLEPLGKACPRLPPRKQQRPKMRAWPSALWLGPEGDSFAEAGRVTGIVLKRCVSEFDENGRFCPR